MIIWGGSADVLGDQPGRGARYRPVTDDWTEVTGEGAPIQRWGHTAVWTGTEMIVWGGYNGRWLAGGGAYDPAADRWHSIADVSLEPRAEHAAVWTGTEMIVWGGGQDHDVEHGDGAAYDPASDSWRSIAKGGPVTHGNHAVWTGAEMILWRGRYDVAADRWRAICTDLDPEAREGDTAVWTGSEVLFWGGLRRPWEDDAPQQGFIYEPGTDLTTPMPMPALGTRLRDHTAVWTGQRMILFGGQDYFVMTKFLDILDPRP